MNGRRVDGFASCKLGKPQGLPPHMHGPIVELSKLYTRPDKRGQSHATALMRVVCDEADAKGKILFLRVDPAEDSPVDEAGLTKFYASYGFWPIQSFPAVLMARLPESKGHA